MNRAGKYQLLTAADEVAWWLDGIEQALGGPRQNGTPAPEGP